MEYTVDAMHWRASTTNPPGGPRPRAGTRQGPPGSTVAPAVTASFVCEGGPVGATIRDYAPGDKEAVVELSLRAWAPVFRSMEQVLGPEIFVRLHGDWQAFQERRSARFSLMRRCTSGWPRRGPSRRLRRRDAVLGAGHGRDLDAAVDPAISTAAPAPRSLSSSRRGWARRGNASR